MFDQLLGAAISSFSPQCLLFNIIGVVIGIVFGAFPGLNGVVGIALLMPLTYGTDPVVGITMLAGIYMGATYGGSISAILLNCPGAAEAACTAINGNLMAKSGRAKEALLYAVISSGIGGFWGCIILIFFTPVLASFALKFGPPEMFLVCLGGLSIVGSLMGSSMAKGFFAVAVGVLFSIVGVDNLSGNYRFTMDSLQLSAGLNLVPMVVGLFAVSEMLSLMDKTDDSSGLVKVNSQDIHQKHIWWVILIKEWWLTLKSAAIGILIGVLPGTGGAIASFVAYGEARRTYGSNHDFGKNMGDERGIIAPEVANNAAVGGSLVPLLALGIPGSSSSALLYGALTVHGIIPGPKLFSEHGVLAYALMFSLIISMLVMVLVGVNFSNLFSKILLVKTKYIVPVVMALCLIGSYSARNSLFDVAGCVVFGMAGLWMKRADIPLAPVLISFILGQMLEENFRRSLLIANAKNMGVLRYVFVRPISIALVIIVAGLIFADLKIALRKNNAED